MYVCVYVCMYVYHMEYFSKIMYFAQQNIVYLAVSY